jgi:hypothetical protein
LRIPKPVTNPRQQPKTRAATVSAQSAVSEKKDDNFESVGDEEDREDVDATTSTSAEGGHYQNVVDDSTETCPNTDVLDVKLVIKMAPNCMETKQLQLREQHLPKDLCGFLEDLLVLNFIETVKPGQTVVLRARVPFGDTNLSKHAFDALKESCLRPIAINYEH